MAEGDIQDYGPAEPDRWQKIMGLLSGMMPAGQDPTRPPGSGNAPPWFSGSPAGLLSGQPTSAPVEPDRQQPALPPSTNDPTAREPEVFQGEVPLPRPRPVTVGMPASQSLDAGAPLSLAPPTQAYAAAPSQAAPAAPPADGRQPNFGISPPGTDLISKILRPENAALLLSLGGGFAGAGSVGTGMRRAFSGAAPAAALMQQQQLQQSTMADTYRALVAKGVPPADALAAVRNPDIMKATAAKYFETKPMSVHDVTGIMGDKKPVVFDPNTGKFRDMNGKPITDTNAAGAGGHGTVDQLMQSGLQGDEFLKAVEAHPELGKGAANTIKMMVEGRLPPPTGMALAKPYWQTMTGLASQYDPSFDQTNWAGRVSSVRDFSSGKSAEMVRAAKQTMHHTTALLDKFDALENRSVPKWNAVGNFVNQEVLGKGAVTGFLPAAHAVAEEMSKVFKGANLSDAEVRTWERSLHENMTPDQQKASIDTLSTLLHGSLTALEQKRIEGMGPALSAKKGPLLGDKETQENLTKIQTWMRSHSNYKNWQAPGLIGREAMPSVTPGGLKWSVE